MPTPIGINWKAVWADGVWDAVWRTVAISYRRFGFARRASDHFGVTRRSAEHFSVTRHG